MGSGGQVRRGLEGKGPTPKAKDRPYHQAHKSAQQKASEGGREPAAKPRRRTGGDAEWVAGRNAVVEALREGVPVTGLYVAEGAERDGRLREAFKIAADEGVSLLEVGRGELDRMTSGAVHQGLAARIPAYEYAHPADLLDRAEEMGEKPLIVALDQVTDPRNLGATVRSAAAFGAHGVVDPGAPGRRHDRLGLEDQRRRRGPDPRRPGEQPGPRAEGLPGGRLHGGRPGRRR